MLKRDNVISLLRSVHELLTLKERVSAYQIVGLSFVSSVFDILGLATVIPVISIVFNPDALGDFQFLQRIVHLLPTAGINQEFKTAIIICTTLITAFTLKAVVALFVTKVQAKFAYKVAVRFTKQLWTYHFSNSLEKLNSTQSGKLIAEINGWPNQFANTFIIGGLVIVNDIILGSIICFGIVLYNPIVFTGIAGFLLCGILLLRFLTKRRLARYSSIVRDIDPRTNTIISNAVRGILEVLSFQASSAILGLYIKDKTTVYDIRSKIAVFNVVPAKLYEILAVGAITLVILWAFVSNDTNINSAELLTVIVISAYRVMPSISRINSYVISMRAQGYVRDAMTKCNIVEGSKVGYEKVSTLHPTASLTVKDLTAGYSEKVIFNEFNAHFIQGKIHSIVGPSGSGKSTLLNVLLGLHDISSGELALGYGDRQGHTKLRPGETSANWIIHFGFVPQQPFLFKGSLAENLTLNMPDRKIDADNVRKLIDDLDLGDCLGADPLSFHIQEGGTNLSGGQQQRVALIRALLLNRPILLLDEATSALDENLKRRVIKLLKGIARSGKIIIMITHDQAVADSCDSQIKLASYSSS